MKKHKQQTSRLEKISDFFEESNFLRLNLYKYFMKFWLSAMLLAIWGTLSAETITPDWTNIHIRKVEKQRRIYLEEGKKIRGSISCGNSQIFKKLEVKAEPSGLKINAENLTPLKKTDQLVIRLSDMLTAQTPLSRNYELALGIKGPVGSEVKIFFEGGDKKGKHYWKAKSYVMDGSKQQISIQRNLPLDLQNLHLRFDLSIPGSYEIYKGTFKELKAKQFDSSRNYILNGGAEYGWYNTGSADMKLLKLSAAGEHLNWNGTNSYIYDSTLSIDNENHVSGKSSFKFMTPQRATSRFHFNPVPTVPGERSYFSVWMKSAEPDTKVHMTLYLASGTAYVKNVKLGKEWKQYELDIPSWGKTAPGVKIFGDPLNCGGSIYNLVTPRIDPPEGKTIWIDNAFYTIGGKGTYKEDADFSIRASLDNAYAYYFTGEKPHARLVLKNNKDQDIKLEISWNVLDYFGETLLNGKVENIILKKGSSNDKDFTFAPPATLRGPVNWNFLIKNLATGKTVPYIFY